MNRLRFGVLNYVNCLQATLGLESGAIEGEDFEVIKGTPAHLNELMAHGQLDVSLVSTAEYLARRSQYKRLGLHSLWCDGYVESVTLFSALSKTELATQALRLSVTSQSATSVALLQILCPSSRLIPFKDSSELREKLLNHRDIQGMLLIGDDALSPPHWTESLHSYDLGSWWAEQTALPMTYAVWVAQRGLSPEQHLRADQLLSQSISWGENHPQRVVSEGQSRSGLEEARVEAYLNRIRFRPDLRAAEGLLEFGGRWALNSLLGRPPRVLQTV